MNEHTIGRANRRSTVIRVAVAVLLSAGLMTGVAACGSDSGTNGAAASSTQGNGRLVNAATFADAITKSGTTIIDVRTPEEFAAGHLVGAVNVDVESSGFSGAIGALDRTATYAVYCRSGNRSAVAVSQMVAKGFTDVYHLDGGITAWAAAGLPIVAD